MAVAAVSAAVAAVCIVTERGTSGFYITVHFTKNERDDQYQNRQHE
jgi:hypothetical protein